MNFGGLSLKPLSIMMTSSGFVLMKYLTRAKLQMIADDLTSANNPILGDFSNFDGIGQVIPNKWFTKKVWI
jgi:hypothetical protein